MLVEENGREGENGKKPLNTQMHVATSTTSQTALPPGQEHGNQKVRKWNTANLGLRIGNDALAAASAAAPVAPLICLLDRSIVEKAATGTTFSSCFLRALRPALFRPHKFIVSKPFLLIFGLYFSTYFTANSMDTLVATIQSQPKHKTFSGTTKFVATSAVNMSMCVYKDSQFATMFGKKTTGPAVIPKLSYLLFAFRDSMTIFASFNLPPLIAPQLQNLPPSIKQRFSRLLNSEVGRTNTAQFIAPAAMQIISTPIHLLGLDLYNRKGQLGFQARFSRIVRDWGVSALARMGRIIPAFGFGGVINGNVRKRLMMNIQD